VAFDARLVRIRLVALGAVAVAVVGGLLWVRADNVIVLPRPTGPFAVGIAHLDWPETRSGKAADSRGTRAVPIWAWYPAARGSPHSPSAPVAHHVPTPVAGESRGTWPRLLLQHRVWIRGHAVVDAPLRRPFGVYPALIIQPGFRLQATDYSALAEELASHGYVVLGITPLPASLPFVRLVALWADHSVLVLNQLDQSDGLHPFGFLAGRIDSRSVGVLGHSLGGASALEACRRDSRFKACADIDGYPATEPAEADHHQPLMIIWSEPRDERDAGWQRAFLDGRALLQRARGGGYQVVIRGTRHFNFSDHAVLGGAAGAAALGPIDGRRGLTITTDYLRAFFDQHLKGTPTPLLLNASPRLPEVQFERFAGPRATSKGSAPIQIGVRHPGAVERPLRASPRRASMVRTRRVQKRAGSVTNWSGPQA
jgi:hypothetical protein